MIYIIISGLILGYLLGSINPAIIFSRLKGKDIRKLGSGNAGATNTLRNFGKGAALIVTLCDILKCIISLLIAGLIAKTIEPGFVLYGKIAAAVGCIMGHNFPLYFGFKGGKGVLVSAAALFMLDYKIGFIAILTFIVVFGISKYVSLGSILSSCIAVMFSSFMSDTYVFLFIAFAAILTIIRHRTNIKRLIKGEESKTTFSKK